MHKISQPDSTKIKVTSLFKRYTDNKKNFQEYVHSITYPEYLPWEKARFKKNPSQFTSEEAWFLGREIRTATAKKSVMRTPGGEHFTCVRLDYVDHHLNKFDMYMGGHFMSHLPRMQHIDQQRFLSRGIIEEAIASSQLEGANVTRRIARDMIAENRTPRNSSEWMIHNNYQMMTKLTEVYADVPLSKELLLEMHAVLCENTMPVEEIGRFREDKDNIVVGSDTVIAHIPPKKKFLMDALNDLIDFANNESEEDFIHPVIKAIQIHFWLGYLHPFTDGNGRIARALFYWMLLKQGYWLATYVPISTVIKKAPAQYSNAFIYSEQDNFDVTYFYDYHMRKIMQALDDFLNYIERQREENDEIDRLLDTKGKLNDRQKQLMHYLLSNQKNYVTITSHAGLNSVSVNTARSDIDELSRMNAIFPMRSGKYIRYFAKPIR